MGVRWLGIPQVEQLELAVFDQLTRARPSEAPYLVYLLLKLQTKTLVSMVVIH